MKERAWPARSFIYSSTTPPIEIGNRAIGLTFDLLLLEIGTLISLLLSFADADLHLHVGVLPVEAESGKGETLDLGLSEQTVDLGSMKEESPDALGFVLLVAGALVWLNVDVIEPRLPIFDSGKRAAEIAMPGTDRFDLGTFQLQASLDPVEDVVIPESLSVDADIAHGVSVTRLAIRATPRPGD